MQVEWLNAQTARVVKGWGSSLLKICNIFRSFVQTTSSYACWYTLCEFFFSCCCLSQGPFQLELHLLMCKGVYFWNAQTLFFSTHQPSSGSSVGGKLETLLEVGDCF